MHISKSCGCFVIDQFTRHRFYTQYNKRNSMQLTPYKHTKILPKYKTLQLTKKQTNTDPFGNIQDARCLYSWVEMQRISRCYQRWTNRMWTWRLLIRGIWSSYMWQFFLYPRRHPYWECCREGWTPVGRCCTNPSLSGKWVSEVVWCNGLCGWHLYVQRENELNLSVSEKQLILSSRDACFYILWIEIFLYKSVLRTFAQNVQCSNNPGGQCFTSLIEF